MISPKFNRWKPRTDPFEHVRLDVAERRLWTVQRPEDAYL
jgi:hypothetical protein